MSRVEFLKKFIAFNKRHRIPIRLIKFQLYIILIASFIKYIIGICIKKLKYVVSFPFVKLGYLWKHRKRHILIAESILALVGICFLFEVYNFKKITYTSTNKGALDANRITLEKESDNGQNDISLYKNIKTGTVVNDGKKTAENSNPQESELLPYLIKVNRLANCVTVYKSDENGEYSVPYKAMICSSGGSETPVGTFAISSKYDFKTLFYQSYGQYCSRIHGSILFHSSTYNSLRKDDLDAADYNLLGEAVSHGCIRLTVADAKWIFDNCPQGTVVVIYDDENPGPLGKPESIKVPEGTVWDPTDPDENNPWNSKGPKIEGVADKVLYEGDTVDYMENVKAYDTCGNDITDEVEISSSLNFDIPGEYSVTYTVTDLLGRTAAVDAIFTVK